MVLVTGGTGLVGSHLLLKLVQNGDSVRAIYRKGSNLERVAKVFGYYTDDAQALFNKIEWVEADITDIPALESAFDQVSQVYHTAALISFDPKKFDILEKINTEGTANVVNLCIAHKIKKLCYTSTIGAIGKSMGNAMANEENPWTSREANVYGLTKQAAEMEVWRGSQEGLSVVMVNPGVIIGPGFWNSGSGDLFTVAQKGYRFYPPGGTGFITVYDVVKMMVALMGSEISNERYIAVAENLTFKEILTKITSELGIKPPTTPLKYWQLEVGRWFDWLKNLFLQNGRRITKNSIRSLKNREIYDNQKIKTDLGFEFEALDEAISFCCKRFTEECL
ncbi:NAD-dependent epimerase/dehydratase family protein [Zobellia galactanivorans]|uniref:NAD-dependent epimerase/dehydratase family n=1 Tax=Zobellia galactanivorans (strain DSM 12802 / CCUG 47099 / CIP 106680 / NCIMB 13871 / Dsij) TaxID=63186 RepID=G0LAJ3_ZOBGA|nr:NAD-dependent epimerase/dehydratase family protein [Zobellia galactanivorans]MBU3028161.1 NAD-dependent epimerase/dehydratase family protein [Zobellia galactanivorans]CAZ95360.1 NAD-dependent epimerase/dehydratase family [Zobellia galactanivorans]